MLYLFIYFATFAEGCPKRLFAARRQSPHETYCISCTKTSRGRMGQLPPKKPTVANARKHPGLLPRVAHTFTEPTVATAPKHPELPGDVHHPASPARAPKGRREPRSSAKLHNAPGSPRTQSTMRAQDLQQGLPLTSRHPFPLRRPSKRLWTIN